MKEFPGLTPTNIRTMALCEVNSLMSAINQYRSKVRPLEIGVDQIRQVLFGFMGVKEQTKDEDVSEKLKHFGLSSARLTEDQRIRWRKAGYPPLAKWMKDHGHRNR